MLFALTACPFQYEAALVPQWSGFWSVCLFLTTEPEYFKSDVQSAKSFYFLFFIKFAFVKTKLKNLIRYNVWSFLVLFLRKNIIELLSLKKIFCFFFLCLFFFCVPRYSPDPPAVDSQDKLLIQPHSSRDVWKSKASLNTQWKKGLQPQMMNALFIRKI